MHLLYEVGLLKVFKSENMTFIAVNHLIRNQSVDIIGCYIDHKDILRRIRRDSPHGKRILDVCGISEYVATDNEKKVKELINGLAGGMRIR